MDREYLKEIANKNLEIFKNKTYNTKNKKYSIEKKLGLAESHVKEYRETSDIPFIYVECTEKIVLFENKDTIEAARGYADNGEVCVLNFASAKHPGGGFLIGARAQEEMLCYKSTLYEELRKHEDLYKWSSNNLKGGLYSDWAIYSPYIVAFRNAQLGLCDPITINVITCPAVNATVALKSHTRSEVYGAMYKKCKLVLDVALGNNQKTLILGAFGCGVFGNRPRDVADIFYNLLTTEGYIQQFDKVIFSVMGDETSDNVREFKRLVSRLNRRNGHESN